jgi:hypothetical protein
MIQLPQPINVTFFEVSVEKVETEDGTIEDVLSIMMGTEDHLAVYRVGLDGAAGLVAAIGAMATACDAQFIARLDDQADRLVSMPLMAEPT